MKQMIGLILLACLFTVNPSYGSGCGGSNWVVVSEVSQGTVPLEMDAFGGAKTRVSEGWGLLFNVHYWNVAVEEKEAYFRSNTHSGHDISSGDIENTLLALPKNTLVEKVLQTLRVDYDDCDETNVGKERQEYVYKFSIEVDDQEVRFTTSYH